MKNTESGGGEKPSCQQQCNQTNPNGQASTMAGTTQKFEPKEMSFATNMAIDPTSSLGHRKFEK